VSVTFNDPATAIVTLLSAQTLGGVTLTSGTNLFADFVYPFPTLSVHCLGQPGGKPQPFISSTDAALMSPNVDVLVYGYPGNAGHDAAETLMLAVMGYLQQSIPSGYISCLCSESYPRQTIEPETGRVLFTATFELRY